jgi:predicted phosphodiesterase
MEKILILSDLHGNGPALAAVLGAEPDATRILCLGDLVNYGPDPGECLRWARTAIAPGDIVIGNHDHLALGIDQTVPPGFPEVHPDVLHHTRSRLTPADRDYLKAIPLISQFGVGGQRWQIVHALPSDPVWGLLHPEARPQRWALEVALAGFPEVLLLGHTHRPFVIERGGAVIVNPGSVGRPKDGDPRASYAIWENGNFSLKRVEYRVEETVAGLARVFRGALLDELAGFLRKGGREVFDDEMAA